MGPVSFEQVDGGTSRTEALARARLLAEAGVRVMSISPSNGPATDGRFHLVVRSADRALIDRVLAERAATIDGRVGDDEDASADGEAEGNPGGNELGDHDEDASAGGKPGGGASGADPGSAPAP